MMTSAISITVIDDEPGMCRILERILSSVGYEVSGFTDPAAAAAHIRKTKPVLVITDMKMPGMSGAEILRIAKEANADAAVIVATAFATIEDCRESMQAGAFDYVTKPWQMDELLATVARAAKQVQLLQENVRLRKILQETLTADIPTDESAAQESTGIAGGSEQICAVRRRILRAAPTDLTVLITGETGTGKELAAQAIHRLSPRKNRRFIAINCANLSTTLLESELFGYEKGAFTGADKLKIGLVELADGGTLFLDEIGEMSRELQARLLRTLQEREVLRVGGHTPIPVDLRVVAATNRRLMDEVQAGRFREDLYHRLHGISVKMPPLRERTEDVRELAQLFLLRAAEKYHVPALQLETEAQDWLSTYAFPGNIRELQNMMERAVAMANGQFITLRDITQDNSSYTIPALTAEDLGRAPQQKINVIAPEPDTETDYKKAREQWEHSFIGQLLKTAKGNISHAARLAGMSRRNLYERMEKLGIKDSE